MNLTSWDPNSRSSCLTWEKCFMSLLVMTITTILVIIVVTHVGCFLITKKLTEGKSVFWDPKSCHDPSRKPTRSGRLVRRVGVTGAACLNAILRACQSCILLLLLNILHLSYMLISFRVELLHVHSWQSCFHGYVSIGFPSELVLQTVLNFILFSKRHHLKKNIIIQEIWD